MLSLFVTDSISENIKMNSFVLVLILIRDTKNFKKHSYKIGNTTVSISKNDHIKYIKWN